MGWTPLAFTAPQTQWVLRERHVHQCSQIDAPSFSNNTLRRPPVLSASGCAGAGSHGGCVALGSPMRRLLWQLSSLRKDEPKRAWPLVEAVVCLPHPDSTFPKGRSPLVVEAPMLYSVVSSMPIRLGRGGGLKGEGGGGGGLGVYQKCVLQKMAQPDFANFMN